MHDVRGNLDVDGQSVQRNTAAAASSRGRQLQRRRGLQRVYIARLVRLVQRSLRNGHFVGRRNLYERRGQLVMDQHALQRAAARLVHDFDDLRNLYGACDVRLVRWTLSHRNLVGSEWNDLRKQSVVVGLEFLPLNAKRNEARTESVTTRYDPAVRDDSALFSNDTSNTDVDLERRVLNRRRAFAIHAFAGLAIAGAPGCERDAEAATRSTSEAAHQGASGKRMGSGPRPAPQSDAGRRTDASADVALHGTGAGVGEAGMNGGRSRSGNRMGASRASDSVVRLDQTTVHGAIAPEAIRRIIRRNVGQIRYCYETAQRNAPALHGELTVSFAIGLDGRVTEAHGAPAVPALETVSTCVAVAFRRWTFPTPTDAAAVSVTQVFSLSILPS